MKSWAVTLSLLLLVLQGRLWAGEGGLAEVRYLQQRISEQSEQNELLAGRNERLRAEVSDLRDSLDSIEERARVDLGMIGEGETFFLLVEAEMPARTPSP